MPVAESSYQTPYGNFELARYPSRHRETLRAWCAADTLLLDEAYRLDIPGSQILVVNDDHGALCVPLQAAALWTDSALATLSLQANAQRNERQSPPVIWSTDSPGGEVSLVLLRVPKHLAYFEYQLSILASRLPLGTKVLAAGMDKHLSPKTAQLLDTWIGPAERHRGRQKARLFSAVNDGRHPVKPENSGRAHYYCEELQSELCSLANVFSRDRLDIGSRFLLQQLQGLRPTDAVVADLACGNGVLGLAAFQQRLGESLLFCDESAMAIESARINCASLFPDRQKAFAFHHGDGLQHYQGPELGLILCNPPFHRNHTVDDQAGRHLLTQCAAHLGHGGQLCLVANRHLDYLPTLKRDFRQVENIAQDEKFKVWLARKN